MIFNGVSVGLLIYYFDLSKINKWYNIRCPTLPETTGTKRWLPPICTPFPLRIKPSPFLMNWWIYYNICTRIPSNKLYQKNTSSIFWRRSFPQFARRSSNLDTSSMFILMKEFKGFATRQQDTRTERQSRC